MLLEVENKIFPLLDLTIGNKTFFKDFIYLVRKRGREGKREGEKHHSVAPCVRSNPTRALAHNLGMCPD